MTVDGDSIIITRSEMVPYVVHIEGEQDRVENMMRVWFELNKEELI